MCKVLKSRNPISLDSKWSWTSLWDLLSPVKAWARSKDERMRGVGVDAADSELTATEANRILTNGHLWTFHETFKRSKQVRRNKIFFKFLPLIQSLTEWPKLYWRKQLQQSLQIVEIYGIDVQNLPYCIS